MGLTGLAQLPSSVRVGLERGEEPLAWQAVDLAPGESRLGRAEPPKAIQGVDLNPVSAVSGGPIDVDPGLFDRLLGGITLTGRVGSAADTLARALHHARNSRLAVTNRRVIVFDEGQTTFGTDPATGAKTWDAETEELWSISRSAVRSVNRRPRPLMAGRLVIEFEDSSTVALMCGMMSPRPANRLRDALLASKEG